MVQCQPLSGRTGSNMLANRTHLQSIHASQNTRFVLELALQFHIHPHSTPDFTESPYHPAPGKQIENIFNPIRGPRDAQLRAGLKPVNHSRNNILAMKEQSQMNALQKQQESQQQTGQFRPLPGNKHSHVSKHCICSHPVQGFGNTWIVIFA